MFPVRSIHSRSASRARFAAMLALVLLASSGCGGPTTADVYLAEYVPFATSGVDSGLMFPRDEGASRFLVRNWPPIRTLRGDTIWVHGSWSHVGFFHVADDPPTFVAEARPYSPPGAPTQYVRFLLNGTEFRSIPMTQGWTTYEIEMPAELIEVGWNILELDFAESLSPVDFEPDSNDTRTFAAQFRSIEMRNAAGRPHWAERPEAVTLAIGEPAAGTDTVVRRTTGEVPSDAAATADAGGQAAAGSDAATGDDVSTSAAAPATPAATPDDLADAAIEMPADSFLDIYLAPGDGAGLLGTVEASFEGDGRLRAVVDAVTPEETTTLWSRDLTPAAPDAEVSVDLTPWAGQVVGLRLRVFGNTNGLARWRGMGITADDVEGTSVVRPDRMVEPPRSGALGRPDVFLIILDAARADRFAGELGAELAPNVQALGADGTVFTRAWAPSSWTGQTIPALLSGMTPDTVGIEHWGSRLPQQIVTFPELVYGAGYHTVLWSQHNIYRARPPLRHGFEIFEEVDSADLTQRVILPAVADLTEEERPTLALIHLLPPHEPYVPPEPFLGSRSGWYEGVPISAPLLNQFDARFGAEQPALRAEIRRAAIDMYDENVAFADHLVGRLVDDLRSQGRYDDALIIVTADHGEAFYEHGRFLHTSALYEEFLRVPLVVKWPAAFDGFAARIDVPVSLIDLAPTLLDGLGIDVEGAAYQGRSLLAMVGGAAPPERMLYAYTSGETDPEKDPKPKYALLFDDLKLIHNARYDEVELYRLSEDPGETDDIAARDDFHTRWLLQTLRLAQAHNAGFLLRAGGARVEDLDEETIRGLRALGYLR